MAGAGAPEAISFRARDLRGAIFAGFWSKTPHGGGAL
jgi:hypothetical protein